MSTYSHKFLYRDRKYWKQLLVPHLALSKVSFILRLKKRDNHLYKSLVSVVDDQQLPCYVFCYCSRHLWSQRSEFYRKRMACVTILILWTISLDCVSGEMIGTRFIYKFFSCYNFCQLSFTICVYVISGCSKNAPLDFCETIPWTRSSSLQLLGQHWITETRIFPSWSF